MDDAVGMSVRGRTAKQDRSERTRGAIVTAVIDTLATEGMAGLTHRLVAQRSGAPLAATTYYFDTKRDMVAAASNELLQEFLTDFKINAIRLQGSGESGFHDFVANLSAAGVADNRRRALAWCEIILNGTRHADGQALVRSWFERLDRVWEQIARDYGVHDPRRAAVAGMNIALAAIFQGLALGLDHDQVRQTFHEGASSHGSWPIEPPAIIFPSARLSPRAAVTRERILDAAIRLLAARGSEAVNCRAVALEAGLTPGTAAYHFASSKALLAETEATLYLQSKARNDEVMKEALESRDLDGVIGLITEILRRETVDNGATNIAGYGAWLQAAREPELRPMMRGIVFELHESWRRNLLALDVPLRGPEPAVMQNQFFGEVIRALTSGMTPQDPAEIRRRLTADMRDMVKGLHWSQSSSITV